MHTFEYLTVIIKTRYTIYIATRVILLHALYYYNNPRYTIECLTIIINTRVAYLSRQSSRWNECLKHITWVYIALIIFANSDNWIYLHFFVVCILKLFRVKHFFYISDLVIMLVNSVFDRVFHRLFKTWHYLCKATDALGYLIYYCNEIYSPESVRYIPRVI